MYIHGYCSPVFLFFELKEVKISGLCILDSNFSVTLLIRMPLRPDDEQIPHPHLNKITVTVSRSSKRRPAVSSSKVLVGWGGGVCKVLIGCIVTFSLLSAWQRALFLWKNSWRDGRCLETKEMSGFPRHGNKIPAFLLKTFDRTNFC